MIDKPRAVLYVEDDPLSRQVMAMMLDSLPSRPAVTILADSHGFTPHVRSLDPLPDLVLLDVQVTPLDGFQMLAELRTMPAYDPVPIIAMTASVTTAEIEDLKAAGFNGLIAKPVRKRLFPELIARIMAGEKIWYVP
ncbi:MAG: response regulator [Chloroflexota bacterium]